jgi:hypothetical protein
MILWSKKSKKKLSKNIEQIETLYLIRLVSGSLGEFMGWAFMGWTNRANSHWWVEQELLFKTQPYGHPGNIQLYYILGWSSGWAKHTWNNPTHSIDWVEHPILFNGLYRVDRPVRRPNPIHSRGAPTPFEKKVKKFNLLIWWFYNLVRFQLSNSGCVWIVLIELSTRQIRSIRESKHVTWSNVEKKFSSSRRDIQRQFLINRLNDKI